MYTRTDSRGAAHVNFSIRWFSRITPGNTDIPNGPCDAIRVDTDMATVALKMADGASTAPGVELLTPGFASDKDWTKGAGWSIASGVATKAAGAATSISQAALVIGASYYVVFTVSGYSAGTITPYCGTTAGTGRAANGTYGETILCATNTNLLFTADIAFAGNIDNVEVYQYTPLLRNTQWEPFAASRVLAVSAGSVWVGWYQKPFAE